MKKGNALTQKKDLRIKVLLRGGYKTKFRKKEKNSKAKMGIFRELKVLLLRNLGKMMFIMALRIEHIKVWFEVARN